jgi:hypothetical protein
MDYENKQTDNRQEDNIDIYLHDTAEDIQLCLNCKKPKCTNCLYWRNTKKWYM